MKPHDATPEAIAPPAAPRFSHASVQSAFPVPAQPDVADALPGRARPEVHAPPRSGAPRPRAGRAVRAAVLFLGLTLPIVLLFGPSLLGKRILLPLDLLTVDRVYIPRSDASGVGLGRFALSDQVFEYEPNRRFVSSELREGRIPLWNPYGYGGAPFANFHKYSPFMWPYYLFDSPRTLPWIQLLVSLVAGGGAYCFFRRALGVSFGAALTGACAYPLVGFFVLWHGYSLTYAAAWLPWLLLAVDATIRRPRSVAPAALAVGVCLVLVSGQVDIAGQALLAAGIFAAGRLIQSWMERGDTGEAVGLVDERPDAVGPSARRTAGGGLVAVSLGCLAGILLASPYLLPLVEYAGDGVRLEARAAGDEERPPVGLSALPAMLLPDAYGTCAEDSYYVGDVNQLEGPAAGYAGLFATLLLAPLAIRARGRRVMVFTFGALFLLAAGWNLAIPGVVQLLRLPGLDFMSHNRFVFVSAFAVVAWAVIALEQLGRDGSPSRHWLFGALIPFAFGVWCLLAYFQLPHSIAADLDSAVGRSGTAFGVDPGWKDRVLANFRVAYFRGATLSGLAVLGWCLVVGRQRRPWIPGVLGVALVAELFWFSVGVSPQSSPQLYYPSVPTLERLRGVPDRVLGYACLPANLHETLRFREVRGYDGVDPTRIVDLLELCRDPRSPAERYNRLQWYLPSIRVDQAGGLVLPPILDMLAVRYVVARGTPPDAVGVLAAGDDYWIAENPRALPRAYVPRRVEATRSAEETLARLSAGEFDPREVAFVESAAAGAPSGGSGTTIGRAAIVDDRPDVVRIEAEMDTPGIVVLADSWDRGWRATVNGVSVPVLLVNHALRGVSAGAGRSEIVFTYRPRSVEVGLALMAATAALLGLWLLRTRRVPVAGGAVPLGAAICIAAACGPLACSNQAGGEAEAAADLPYLGVGIENFDGISAEARERDLELSAARQLDYLALQTSIRRALSEVHPAAATMLAPPPGDVEVSSVAELVAALREAHAGSVLHVPGTVQLDVTRATPLRVPAGVTVTSDRGKGSSGGARLFTNGLADTLFLLQDGARLVGLDLMGPDPGARTYQLERLHAERGRSGYYTVPVSVGVLVHGRDVLVENCEIWGFSRSGVEAAPGSEVRVRHCFLHHIQRFGLGYGVYLDQAEGIVEANLFDWYRHCVAGSGRPGTAYEAGYNFVLDNASGHAFDMHGSADRGESDDLAGSRVSIHHNIVEAAQYPAVVIRGSVEKSLEIYANQFRHPDQAHTIVLQGGAGGRARVDQNVYGVSSVRH